MPNFKVARLCEFFFKHSSTMVSVKLPLENDMHHQGGALKYFDLPIN